MSDRVLAVVLDFEEDVLRLICGYAVQSGKRLEEKQSSCRKCEGNIGKVVEEEESYVK